MKMAPALEVVGVHPVDAPEPCHVVEIVLRNRDERFDFGTITQEVPGLSSREWQTPWDERVLSEDESGIRDAFFFHGLRLDKPLLTPFGEVQLPQPAPLPPHLKGVKYEGP